MERPLPQLSLLWPELRWTWRTTEMSIRAAGAEAAEFLSWNPGSSMCLESP